MKKCKWIKILITIILLVAIISLQASLLMLKLFNIINWNWLLIFSPSLIIGVLILLSTIVITIACMIISGWCDERNE